jgi:hypothetical protein
MPEPQIRIMSDGTGHDTVVTTADGRQLYPVSATIWINANRINEVDLRFVHMGTDIHADVHTVTMICPLCEHEETHKCPGKKL